MTRIVVHALEGVEPPIVARVSGEEEAIRAAAAGLPEGAARPEAIAARVARAGGEVSWGEPDPAPDARSLLRFCGERGASSVELVRADPTLLPYLQLGSYFERPVARRALRRLLLSLPGSPIASSERAADAAFWAGARSAATAREWRRLTRSSYVVLLYHRVAERKAGQERLNVSPEAFERQMRWLRRFRVRPLGVEELVRFHADPEATLPRRAIVLSADDAFRDAVLALGMYVDLRPLVFVPTAAVGGGAPWPWAAGEPIASWSELEDLSAAGGTVASHARSHAPLPELDAAALAHELTESLRELRAHVPGAAPVLAYPHGVHGEAVRAAAERAGYDAAFTTEAGRNGAGTDRFRLRRVEPKDWDGAAALAWKALTGESVPWSVERWRLRLRGLR